MISIIRETLTYLACDDGEAVEWICAGICAASAVVIYCLLCPPSVGVW